MKCPNCALDKPLTQFESQPWCGSPGAQHDVCWACQTVLRVRYAKQLAQHFARLMEAGLLAA